MDSLDLSSRFWEMFHAATSRDESSAFYGNPFPTNLPSAKVRFDPVPDRCTLHYPVDFGFLADCLIGETDAPRSDNFSMLAMRRYRYFGRPVTRVEERRFITGG
jgi:hypothetical protein